MRILVLTILTFLAATASLTAQSSVKEVQTKGQAKHLYNIMLEREQYFFIHNSEGRMIAASRLTSRSSTVCTKTFIRFVIRTDAHMAHFDHCNDDGQFDYVANEFETDAVSKHSEVVFALFQLLGPET